MLSAASCKGLAATWPLLIRALEILLGTWPRRAACPLSGKVSAGLGRRWMRIQDVGQGRDERGYEYEYEYENECA